MTDRPKLVSILTATYNDERFIGACIDSVLAQTYPHWEMVILDDGSTDRTPEIVASYADPRIKYLRQENTGFGGGARRYEVCLQHTDGELVACLAGDDAWPAEKLELLVPQMEDGVALAFGRGVQINGEGKVISEPRLPKRFGNIINRPIGTVLQDLLVWNFIPSYAALMSMESIKAIGGFQQPEGVLGVDSPTCMALALQGEFRYVDTPTGYWRVHQGQQTGNYRLEQSKSDTEYALRFYRELDEGARTASGWSEADLEAALDRDRRNAIFETGRRHLLSGRRREALGYFIEALKVGAPVTKAKALAGLVCGVTGADLEKLVRVAGRTALR